MSADKLRALVIDDSALYRKVVRTVLEEVPGVEVVGVATNGRVGLDLVRRERIDFVTLDLEMPELDGLGFLREAKSLPKMPGVLMLSARTAQGTKVTTEALELGAFDFVLKPAASDLETSLAQIRQQLVPKVQAFQYSKSCGTSARTENAASRITTTIDCESDRARPPRRPEYVAIGVSTGGPAALAEMLPQLPANFPLPILIVQHMPPAFTKTLAEDLDGKCRLKVKEAQGDESPKPGEVYLAPGGRHMKLEKVGPHRVIKVTDDPAERSCRPSVDYLFRSLSHLCGRNTIGLIMTGMGDDGLLGCKLLRRQGGLILAQSRETCVVYGMPKCVIEEGVADEVLELKSIAGRLVEIAASHGAPTCR
jgi:two-component system chemotaxis response regulator CheB